MAVGRFPSQHLAREPLCLSVRALSGLLQVPGGQSKKPTRRASGGAMGWVGAGSLAPRAACFPSLVFCPAGSQPWPPLARGPLCGSGLWVSGSLGLQLLHSPQTPRSCLGTPASSWAVARIPSRLLTPPSTGLCEERTIPCVSLHSVLTQHLRSPPLSSDTSWASCSSAPF